MGRNKVRLSINPEKLRSLIKENHTFSEMAQKYGVTKQAVSQWVTDGQMPPRAIVELVKDLDISSEDVEELLAPQMASVLRRRREMPVHPGYLEELAEDLEAIQQDE